MNIFSEQKAFELATPSTYQKGKEYFEDGLVEKVWKEDGVYKAKVSGTHVYTVTFHITADQLETVCTCPYDLGGICKHTVAAIFAFAEHADYKDITEHQQENTEDTKKLVASATEGQLRTFLQILLDKNKSFIKDFTIFLQGPKETATTLKEYKEKVRYVLDQLDMHDVLQAWYADGDDYDDYHPEYAPEMGPTLAEVTEPFFSEAEKYLESNNTAECLKLYQALFEALDEKLRTLHGDETELQDWFTEEMEKALHGYGNSLASTRESSIKTIGVEYLCRLFIKQEEWYYQIVSVIKQAVTSSSDSQTALAILPKSGQTTELSIDESSLYAFLHFMHEDFKLFESICLNHMKDNSHLAVDVLRYYQKQGEKIDIISASEKILPHLEKQPEFSEFVYPRQSFHYEDIEKEIRLILKETYDLQSDYIKMVENLERLFIITESLSDYKEVAKVYKSQGEKEAYIERLKGIYEDHYEINPLFKLLQYEKKKKDILTLIAKFPDAECFPQMITSIQNEFPEECFLHYQNKIKCLLKEANVKYYPQVAYHLKRMEHIGCTKEFEAFVSWIKETYRQRRRLMEELKIIC